MHSKNQDGFLNCFVIFFLLWDLFDNFTVFDKTTVCSYINLPVIKLKYLFFSFFFVMYHKKVNRIGGVMVRVLSSCAVDRGFEPRSGQTKEYGIGICRFSVKHAALRRKSKD